jgi:hypothetical protein
MAMKWGMPRNIYLMRWCNRWPIAALLSLVLVASGCSGNSVGTLTTAAPPVGATPAPSDAAAPSPPAGSPSFKDKIANFFSGASANGPQAVANAQPDVDCPYIDIRQGASTLTIPPPPPDGSNETMALRYQGNFVRAARECAVVAGQMVMKVGVQGRIIVGPAGGPGQVEVPLRIAVVEAPAGASKTIVTKLIRIPVAVGNDDSTPFTHIEEGLSFPLPSSSVLDTYIVYIGFDPVGAATEDQQRGRPEPKIKPKPKAKPSPNPSAPSG